MATADQLVMICPSRGRPGAVAQLRQAWADTGTTAQLLVVVDHDDPQLAAYQDGGPVVVSHTGGGMGPVLNDAAAGVLLMPGVAAVGFLGDDHRPRTHGWDPALLDAATTPGPGVAYGDDLHQREALPTAVVIAAPIVSALGYMVPPGMVHLYLDNFWQMLGHALGALRYRQDAVIEHLHPHAGKAAWDEGYRRVNDAAVWEADKARLDAYVASFWPAALQRVRAAVAQMAA